MDKKTILNKIKKELSKKLNVQRVYLFGSMSRGDYTEDSDYDLAIISKDFEGKSFQKRQEIVRPLLRNILPDAPIETVCYTKKEYEKGKSAFLPRIIEKEGIKV